MSTTRFDEIKALAFDHYGTLFDKHAISTRISQMGYQFDDLLGRFCYKNQCDTNTTTSQPRVTRRVNPKTPICGSISTVA